MPQQHEVVYVGSERSGAEIWHCRECGHRLLTRWQPRFEVQVLAEGDPQAVHTGNMGAAPAGHVLRGPAAALTRAERAWLHGNGIDWNERGGQDDG